MKRIILLMISVAMILCLFAGCKSAGVQEESAVAGDLISGSAQEDANQDSDGPQKVENQQSGDAEQSGGNTQQGNNQQSGDAQQGGSNDQPSNDGQQSGGNQQQGGSNNTQQGGGNDQPSNDQQQGGEGEDPYAAMKADQSGTKVKIMCQNLRLNSSQDQGGDNDAKLRRYRLQSLVEKYDPDIIACQEADPFWIDTLAQDYGVKYGFFYKQRGVIPGASSSDEASPVLWKKDKYTKLEDGYFWLSKTPNECSASYEEGQLPRICNWVKLKDNATGVKFYILSVHYGFYKDDASIAGIRDQILNFFKNVDKDEYAFCMGDYNFNYQNDQYYVYTDGVNMIDLRPTAEEMASNGHLTLGEIRNGAYNAFEHDDGTAFGDIIMTTPRKKMTMDTFGYLYEKLGNEAHGTPAGFISDHFAVYTEVRLNTDISYEEYWGKNAK